MSDFSSGESRVKFEKKNKSSGQFADVGRDRSLKMTKLNVVFLMLLSSFLGGISATALAQSQVELKVGDTLHIGKPIASNKKVCWLAAPSGKFTRVVFSQVTEFSKYEKTFRAQTLIEAKNALRDEFGRSMDVVIRGPFVIAAPHGHAHGYAEILDKMSRSFSRYISVRRIPIVRTEYPLIVVVYPDEKGFAEYCRTDGMFYNRNLQGYYHPFTNRVALFERQLKSGGTRGSAKEKLPQQTVSTLIHEGIHQLAFNYGLHSRLGSNPRWVVEGLAMMMESDGMLKGSKNSSASTLNESRLDWFLRYRTERRTETVADFIANDESFFQKNALDAYSQAWAISYFLAEEYPSAYAKFLKNIAGRDPLLGAYRGTERVEDIESIFGQDLQWLEVKFTRFIDDLETQR